MTPASIQLTRSHPVDIVGQGLVCCLGEGADRVYQEMCGGACGFRAVDRFPVDDYAQKNAGTLPLALEEQLREEFPEDDLALAMLVHAGREALQQAGLWPVPEEADGPGIALVLGTNFGPMETLEWCWRERVDTGQLSPESFRGWQDFPARVARALGCRGPVAQVSMSCASGASVAAVARDWICTGTAERVLAIGYDVLTEYCWCGLSNLRTITDDTVRPFDRRRSGTLFSEGAAAWLLESPRSRKAGSRPLLAQLMGAACNNNAFHMTAPAREGAGSRRVMAAALADADCPPERIEHICAHATGTRANDPTEVAAFQHLFGKHLAEMTVAAHKSQFGHMMGAAGLAEAIITVQAMRFGAVPPTLHHHDPDPECIVDCVPGAARQRRIDWAITNSAGLGGNNGALVLRSSHGLS